MKPGEKVRVVPGESVPNSHFVGMEGVIEKIVHDDMHATFAPRATVAFGDLEGPVPFWLDELELVQLSAERRK